MISYEEFTKRRAYCQQKFKSILGYSISSRYLHFMKTDKITIQKFDIEFINKFLYDSLIEIQKQNITFDRDLFKLNNDLYKIYCDILSKHNLTEYVEKIDNIKKEERQKRELDKKFAKVLDMIHKLSELNIIDETEILKNINKQELEKLLERESDL